MAVKRDHLSGECVTCCACDWRNPLQYVQLLGNQPEHQWLCEAHSSALFIAVRDNDMDAARAVFGLKPVRKRNAFQALLGMR